MFRWICRLIVCHVDVYLKDKNSQLESTIHFRFIRTLICICTYYYNILYIRSRVFKEIIGDYHWINYCLLHCTLLDYLILLNEKSKNKNFFFFSFNTHLFAAGFLRLQQIMLICCSFLKSPQQIVSFFAAVQNCSI